MGNIFGTPDVQEAPRVPTDQEAEARRRRETLRSQAGLRGELATNKRKGLAAPGTAPAPASAPPRAGLSGA